MASHNLDEGAAIRSVVRRSTAADAQAYQQCVASVARERRYLLTVDGFSLEDTRMFLQRIEARGLPQVVALSEDAIVGWCDVIPKSAPDSALAGTLGMGVLKEWRRKGIGRRLIGECLALARAHGLERVELTVFADNAPAIRLYEAMGFAHEGRTRNTRKIDGYCQDELLMALPLQPAA